MTISNEEKIKLSIIIIIVSYNREQCVREALSSIFRHFNGRVSYEIIMVNNDESNDLSELKREFPEIKVMGNGKNIGFGAGNNLGAKIAKGEFLLFLNPDTEILTDNISELLDEFDKDSQIGIIGGQLWDKNNRPQKWSAGKATNFWDILRNNAGFPRSRSIWESKNVIECDWVAGTAMFIRRELFNLLGSFDEGFFIYFEDADLCKRVRNFGQKVIFYGPFSVLHKGGESYSNKKRQKKNYYDSQEYYFKKHRTVIEYWLIKFLRKALFKA